MSEQRRRRLHLEISREAARLFWAQGVAATTGEQIAEAVGLSVRTLWRHFRTKESCAEPIIAQSAEWFVAALRRWPRELSIEEHLRAEKQLAGSRTHEQLEDDLAAVRMVRLGETEPALRSAWLMSADEIERVLLGIIAARLGRSEQDVEVRRYAASVTGAARVINEVIGERIVRGELTELGDPFQDLATALRVATGGAVGDPVD
ncbi:AcrR family transcriptional regulator [Crossiella equi]|uniref:AcrR family transcriptional regulator n=1 Tax=Crossiella equi TaxID=130796 RepID=A0ABS5A4P2_9PSEU|nr:TetR/AcrR family transcriptional regulator [Crossiella equi]MBP2471212.1 AcrR family transcriptional regulator [Crossiella equi]